VRQTTDFVGGHAYDDERENDPDHRRRIRYEAKRSDTEGANRLFSLATPDLSHTCVSIYLLKIEKLGPAQSVVIKAGAGADLARHLDTDMRMKLTG
jgi:hypothetical protein